MSEGPHLEEAILGQNAVLRPEPDKASQARPTKTIMGCPMHSIGLVSTKYLRNRTVEGVLSLTQNAVHNNEINCRSLETCLYYMHFAIISFIIYH